ncbi:helix-turn-helix domain-containing protein [Streptomyces filamentosus]|uniref:helix-turn-helix domain-containing protein n=1 Tax=Streptomyces filamentosus TaxID=67294 RepID=UPI00382790CE
MSSTDFQSGREALGARLRELRTEAGLTGKALAQRLDWPASKVSRLQAGKQTPSSGDLEAWAQAVGKPGVVTELKARLAGLETTYRSWRRQLVAGHRARQEQGIVETAATSLTRAVEIVRVPGLLQTPEYARNVFEQNAEFRQTPRDVVAAVRARMQRQEALRDPNKRFHFLLHEPALHARTCPVPVQVAQLNRLLGVARLETVRLGIVPLGARLRRVPSHGFWIYDRRLVIVETISTEMWLEDEASIRLYERSWEWFEQAAVYGEQAQRLIGRVRAALGAV